MNRRYDASGSCMLMCPNCRAWVNASATRYGTRHTCTDCGLWSWGGAPMVSGATHAARKAAHEAFDPIWQNGLTNRKAAYTLLGKWLDLPKDLCHMKLMDERTAWRAIRAAPEIKRWLQEQQEKKWAARNR